MTMVTSINRDYLRFGNGTQLCCVLSQFVAGVLTELSRCLPWIWRSRALVPLPVRQPRIILVNWWNKNTWIFKQSQQNITLECAHVMGVLYLSSLWVTMWFTLCMYGVIYYDEFMNRMWHDSQKIHFHNHRFKLICLCTNMYPTH